MNPTHPPTPDAGPVQAPGYDVREERDSAPARTDPLAEEIATYHRELPRLLAEGREGQFVVIEGTEVVAVFPSRSDALAEGYRRFGHAHDFLVRQLKAEAAPVRIPTVFAPPCPK